MLTEIVSVAGMTIYIYTVTLYTLMIINNWFIIMVSQGIDRVYATARTQSSRSVSRPNNVFLHAAHLLLHAHFPYNALEFSSLQQHVPIT